MAVNWISLVGLVISAPCIVLNIIVMTALYRDRHLHTITHIFIFSLAIADLLVGAVNVPVYVVEQNNGNGTFLDCVVSRSFTMFFILASVAHLLLIAIDRYIAITFPLRYPALVTKQRAVWCLLAFWLLSIVAGFAPLFGWRKSETRDMGLSLERACGYHIYMAFSYIMFMGILWYAIPVTIMLVLYALIFCTASEQVKKIREIHRSIEHLNQIPTEVNNPPAPPTVDQRKAARVLCATMGCFLVCTLPGLISIFISVVTETGVSYFVCNLTLLIVFLNSALNPLLYGIGNRQVRRSIKKLLSGRAKTAVASANVRSFVPTVTAANRNESTVTLSASDSNCNKTKQNRIGISKSTTDRLEIRERSNIDSY
ncbi:alpha-1A adrenergic receptor-like [Ptychodera flava]|uniref:alpha-1A adrenergic receptor-like n=1 Tax=Ptychodera flava TaxID=63121 RepID=UPI00396A64A6